MSMAITEELYRYYKTQCKAYEAEQKKLRKPRVAKVWAINPDQIEIIAGGFMVRSIRRLSQGSLSVIEEHFENVLSSPIANIDDMGFLSIVAHRAVITEHDRVDEFCEVLNRALNS